MSFPEQRFLKCSTDLNGFGTTRKVPVRIGLESNSAKWNPIDSNCSWRNSSITETNRIAKLESDRVISNCLENCAQVS